VNFFNSVTLFRAPTALLQSIVATMQDPDADEGVTTTVLAKGLAECAKKPIGPQELATYGFVAPYGRASELLANTIGDTTLVTLAGERKLLPPSTVNDLLQKKLDEIEEKEGRRPGGRTRKRLKEEIITTLLPNALTKPTRISAIINAAQGFIAVDTGSRKVAEHVVSELRRAVGSLPALPINAETAPRSVLTGWVAGEALPDGLSLGDECVLRDALDQGAIVKCSRMELSDNAEIEKHLQSGKQVTRLALTLDDHVSFVLDEDIAIRKFRMLDGAVESLENSDREDLHAELDARLTLMAHEMTRLFVTLESALKLSKVE
jgi:recombination associated protein RdgC